MSKPTLKMKLVPGYENHLGFCQVTYWTYGTDGKSKIVYCLQDNGERFGGVKLLRCTSEWEPSHEVSFSNHRLDFERPKETDRTCKAVNQWISRYEGESE